MRIRISVIALLLIALCSNVYQAKAESLAEVMIKEPEYAKWSRLAFQEAGKSYKLVDFKYLGRTDISATAAEQRFRFWASKNNREFPLLVTIRYNPLTEKVISISVKESTPSTQGSSGA
ncbi:DUF3889 domain-containing protein [Paenibacillus eucommiae]|uniref:DUF3889 domain-containing protein n=1 Tax=Paenibacillus eucommiae TaxID=1355755 RepID=A0ABS4J781_9BACL|nr:DUF3889 domain-containing protein [Paenibacillus eucommiae]MBP1995704.1 hypothetical protein [Paenibacillus eucommiae]